MNFDLDAGVADKAGEVILQGKQVNRLVLVPNAIIAATILVHLIKLITFNASDFEHVTHLSLHSLSS